MFNWNETILAIPSFWNKSFVHLIRNIGAMFLLMIGCWGHNLPCQPSGPIAHLAENQRSPHVMRSFHLLCKITWCKRKHMRTARTHVEVSFYQSHRQSKVQWESRGRGLTTLENYPETEVVVIVAFWRGLICFLISVFLFYIWSMASTPYMKVFFVTIRRFSFQLHRKKEN